MSSDRRQADAAFAIVLREFRVAAQFSQERLADATGLDRTYISLLERGLCQPSLPTLLAISKALGVTLAAMATRIEHEIDHDHSWTVSEGRPAHLRRPDADHSAADPKG